MLMATKKKNLKNQLKSALYQQFYAAKGESRHAEKKRTGQHAHYDKIYARQSLKTHLSRAEQFADWVKSEHPEIKKIDEITKEVAGQYLQLQVEKGYSVRTVESDMGMINHVVIGTDAWAREDALTKREFNLPSRSKHDIVNNRGDKTASSIAYNEQHQKIVEFGQTFGLRRSELVPNQENDRYAVGAKSLYEKEGRVYAAVIGKGGRYRTVEALENRQSDLKEEYGQFIQKVEQLPAKEEFLATYDKTEHLFNSISNNVRIHRDCRQFYANEKLQELEQNDRHFELLRQNKLETGRDIYQTNGRTMMRDHAQFISQQLGHNRVYELQSYINLN